MTEEPQFLRRVPDDGARLPQEPRRTRAQQRWVDSIGDADDLSKQALDDMSEALENWDIIAPGHQHGKILGLIRNFRIEVEEKKRLLS
jgi:hypothetical protein